MERFNCQLSERTTNS